MKAIFALSVFSFVFTLPLFAGRDNVVVTFSTKGPDKYADGSTVMDGERYALVWTPAGATFGGFCSDGSAVAPSKVAFSKPLAKDGCCPQTKFEIDEAWVKANYPGGTWGVYLLDTRRFATDANGVIKAGEVASVGGDAVNGYGVVSAQMSGSLLGASTDGELTSGLSSTIPENGRDFRIKDIKVVDGQVRLSVSNTKSCMRYKVLEGEDPGALGAVDGERYGKDGEDLEIVLPKKGDGNCGFYVIEGK